MQLVGTFSGHGCSWRSFFHRRNPRGAVATWVQRHDVTYKQAGRLRKWCQYVVDSVSFLPEFFRVYDLVQEEIGQTRCSHLGKFGKGLNCSTTLRQEQSVWKWRSLVGLEEGFTFSWVGVLGVCDKGNYVLTKDAL